MGVGSGTHVSQPSLKNLRAGIMLHFHDGSRDAGVPNRATPALGRRGDVFIAVRGALVEGQGSRVRR